MATFCNFWPKKCWHHQKYWPEQIFSLFFGKILICCSFGVSFSFLGSFLKILDWGGVILPPIPLTYIKKPIHNRVKIFIWTYTDLHCEFMWPCSHVFRSFSSYRPVFYKLYCSICNFGIIDLGFSRSISFVYHVNLENIREVSKSIDLKSENQ